jgi:DNA (cytosine-5)-methyltransferase 1
MRMVSLFAGVGGFDLAAERVGIEVVGQVENHGPAVEVLERHWPLTPRWEDIHDVAAGDVRGCDILAGGFPCQSYSVAGRRGGLAEDRGALWWEFHRLIAGVRPTWVVGENVPGLLSSNGGRDFGTIIGSLTDLGYSVTWAVLDSQWFGVAQRRRRVFIVGHSGGVPRPEVLALAEGLCGHPPPRREAGSFATQAFTGSTYGGGGADDNRAQGGFVVPATAPPLMARSFKSPNVEGGEDVVVPLSFQSNAGSQMYVHEDQSPPLTVASGTGGNPPAVAFTQNSRDEVRDLGDLAGSLTADQGSHIGTNIAQPAGVRRLTPTECERLQGFPDGWTDNLSDTQRYRAMGNAVTVNVAEWILGNLKESDDE